MSADDMSADDMSADDMSAAAQPRNPRWVLGRFLPRPLRIAYYLVLVLFLVLLFVLLAVSAWEILKPGSVSGHPFLSHFAFGVFGLIEASLAVLVRMDRELSSGRAPYDTATTSPDMTLFVVVLGLAIFGWQFTPLLIHPQHLPIELIFVLYPVELLLFIAAFLRPWRRDRPARVSRLSVILGVMVLAITIGSFGWLLHELPTLVPLAEFHSDKSIEAVSWAPGGHSLAAVDGTARISILSPADGHVLRSFQACYIDVGNAVRWAPDGTRVALRCPHPQIQGNDSGIIQANDVTQIWNVTTRRMVLELSQDNIAYEPWCAWSPDGSRIAAVDDHGILHIWESASGQEAHTLQLPDQYYDAIAWAPDGHALALGGGRGLVTLVDARTWRVSAVHTADVGIAHLLAWSPDSQRLAVADDTFERPCAVAVLNAVTGYPIATFRGHTDSVDSLSWSPDGRYIASGSDDQSVRVWTSDTGKAVYTWRGHFGRVESVQWSPLGDRIASGGWDDTVQVWQPDLPGA